jgi:dTDP-4-amino-4,6-dideoxygalactose transaminase
MAGAGLFFFGAEEEASVLEVLRSRQLSRYRAPGDPEPSMTARFESELAGWLGVENCLGLNSGTSALLTGLLALGIGPGDEVIVPGYTFVATIASVVYTGATPVLAEIDGSLTLDPADVERRITPRTRAIIAVHMLGAPCDLAALGSIARAHGLALVEDVAQACGGRYRGRALGSWGRFGAFSLNVFKVITAGDGGALATNDRGLFERAFSIHDHGFRRFEGGAVDGNGVFGLNLRMHEMTGAVALAQVRKLDRILAHLRRRKALLVSAIGQVPGLERRAVHDADGECSTTAVYLADRPARARRMADYLGTRTLAESVKHNYASMGQLLGRALPNARCPFACPGLSAAPDYRPGMLPRTDDLLARSIGVGVGVQDSFLGFGLAVDMDADDVVIEAAGERFRRAAEAS